MSRVAIAGAPPQAPGRTILIAIVAAEATLLAAGFLSGHPLAAAAAALAVLYFVIAFRFPDLAMALAWISVPPNVEIVIPGGAAVTVPTEPMILIALAAWLAKILLRRESRLAGSPLHLPLAALAGLALLSTLWSVRPTSTLKAWAMMGGYVAFGYLYFSQRTCSPERRRQWLLLVSLTGAAWGIYGVVRVLLAGHANFAAVASTYSYGAFRPFFREHGTYSAYLSMILPVSLLAALERRGVERVAHALCAGAIAAGVILAFARAGWLAVAIVLPITLAAWAAWRRGTPRLWIPILLAAAVALFIGSLGIGRQMSRHVESIVNSENISNVERLGRWSAALAMARDRPWTGVGYGCYLDAYPAYHKTVIATEQSYVRMGAHSEPLKMLSELGLPGLIATVWFLAAVGALGIRAFRRLARPEDRFLALAVLAGLGTYTINGIFNAYLAEDKVTVPFWVGIGVIAALGRGLNRDAGRERESRRLGGVGPASPSGP